MEILNCKRLEFCLIMSIELLREMIMPVARYLGIPPENVFANRMFFQSDDETGLPTKFAGPFLGSVSVLSLPFYAYVSSFIQAYFRRLSF